jgi:hypothetical protein
LRAPLGGAEPVVDRRVMQGIMVADKQDNRALGPVELPACPGKQVARDPGMVEQVTRDEQAIHVGLDGKIDGPGERSFLDTIGTSAAKP